MTDKNYLDLLLHIERLTEEMNKRMAPHSQNAFKRYPLTFTLLGLFGVVAVSEGLKKILDGISFFQNSPFWLLITGLIILTILGSVYKKLSK
jgi:hypothetical protein